MSRSGSTLLGCLLKSVALIAVWATVSLTILIGWFAWDLPDVRTVAEPSRRPSLTLLAADGSVFQRLGDVTGDVVDSRLLPTHLVQAVLATEDRRFFSHPGIDPIGLVRALWANWKAGRMVQGGSTLTQQLAKNLFLTSERSLRRKVQEVLLALWLEHRYAKHEILTAYLNRVYLGAGTYGVDAAARVYFGRSAMDVDLAEAAVLAGLLKAPSRFSPARNQDEAAQRASIVLDRMVADGMITPAAAAAARYRRSSAVAGKAPFGRWFADWVAEQAVAFGGGVSRGLVIKTTFDPAMQRVVDTRMVASLVGPGNKRQVEQAAVVVMDKSGAVRAMAGGRDWAVSPFNRATRASRQPGSAFKPFVFLAGLQAGLSPDSLVSDRPLTIAGWSPRNFEPGSKGDITLTQAFANSINTAAVRVMMEAGIERVRALTRALGIISPLGHDLSLALGTSEVTLMELTGAYAAIAGGGRSVWPYAITAIFDQAGVPLYQRAGLSTATIDPSLIRLLTGMMVEAVDVGTGRAARLDRPVAGKTGTTNEYRDAWFVGFTADLIAGVWMGNDDRRPMARVTGGSLPAQLWHDIMAELHLSLPAQPLLLGTNTSPPDGPLVGNLEVVDPLARLLQEIDEDPATKLPPRQDQDP